MKNFVSATLLCDFYKVSHKNLYPKGTELIYSTFTPRSNKYFPTASNVVVAGIQGFVKKYLINYFNEHFFNRDKETVVSEYERVIKYSLGVDKPDSAHIAELHDLGYLPIKLTALKEGTLVPIKTPVLTIENTNPKFFWLTNYLETLISTEIWQMMTSATIAKEYRKLLDKYAMQTVGNKDAVGFQGHDFSMRGMSSLETAMLSGAGHLLFFTGTDTIPAILYLEEFYNANMEKELIAGSIPATEHSIMSAGTPYGEDLNEYDTFKRIITEVHPSGLVSIVSDTYDFWKVVTETLPQLKNEIMTRDGKLVVRPDSGDPVEIICGKNLPEFDSVADAFDNYELEFSHDAKLMLEDKDEDEYSYKEDYEVRVGNRVITLHFKAYKTEYEIDEYFDYSARPIKAEDKGLIECLWDTFGGTVTEQCYKLLDSHIGAIYGDSITIERAEEICKRLEQKEFASVNVVFGIGSYTYQHNTRDTLGFAMKATFAEINGEKKLLFKDPKTDDGTKRSQKGRVRVYKEDNKIKYEDGLLEVVGDNMLETVFENGKLLREQSLSEIRKIAQKGVL